ncbi:MAG: MBOAT family protein [Candidatus Wallbacteria bacterium]|nr:MBOAT family protein [Candidatus Wallbacteria bacterium]
MAFNSFQFLLFFPAAVILNYLLPARHRWKLLLSASYFFYMCWNPIYALLLLASTISVYNAALAIEPPSPEIRRKAALFSCLTVNLGILSLFKYDIFSDLDSWLWWTLDGIPVPEHALSLIMPVGLSFYTFQALGYLLDVYRGKIRAERHFGIFALFVSFFPQLLSGPIGRAQALIPQLVSSPDFSCKNACHGILLMSWGLFKKVVVADRISLFVSYYFDTPETFSGPVFILAAILYAFQLYCDLSGYTDMARGAARVLGISLAVNFRLPYFSASISEFWRRWHVTLSSWFFDYLYTPLAVRLRGLGTPGISLALLITFALCGIWHGGGWNFLIFGLLQGLALSFEMLFRKKGRKISKLIGARIYSLLSKTLTFCYWTFSLIFFRTGSPGDAFHIIRTMFLLPDDARRVLLGFNRYNFGNWDFFLVLAMICFVLVLERRQAEKELGEFYGTWKAWCRWTFCYFLLFAIVSYGVMDEQLFIYFQF